MFELKVACATTQVFTQFNSVAICLSFSMAQLAEDVLDRPTQSNMYSFLFLNLNAQIYNLYIIIYKLYINIYCI